MIALLLQGAFAVQNNFGSEDMFLQLAEEPAAKADIPPVEEKIPDANVETVDDQVNKQIHDVLAKTAAAEKKPIVDENGEAEQNAILSKIK